MSKKPYRVSCPQGGCTVIYTASERSAARLGKRIFDRNSDPDVRPATEQDINWVKGMGGRIHGKDAT